MKSKSLDDTMYYGANQFIFDKAKELRNNMTLSELILWKTLRNRDIVKVKFRRQHPINHFIVDFYCHQCKLAIEIDGEIHFNKDQIEHDTKRACEIEKLGIKVLRFSNEQVILNQKSVIDQILTAITT